MPVIASTSRRAYFAAMLAILLRVLTLLALAWMPLGMTPAAAAPQHALQASSAGHCDEGQPTSQDFGGKMDCTVTCAAVAPSELPLAAAPVLPAMPLWAAAMPDTVGLTPEAATPPPKRI